MYLRPRVWWTVCSVCVALMAWTDARAAVIAPAPGQTVETLFEEVVLVFDPLTGIRRRSFSTFSPGRRPRSVSSCPRRVPRTLAVSRTA